MTRRRCADRVPVLCYGSNVCPSKLTWLRTRTRAAGARRPAARPLHRPRRGLGQRAAGRRRPAARHARRPARQHARTTRIWLATPDQVAVLDRCEGRGERYRLARVDTGEVRLADGTVVDGPLAYTAAAPRRHAAAGRRQAGALRGRAAVRRRRADRRHRGHRRSHRARGRPAHRTRPSSPAACSSTARCSRDASDWWRLEPHATGEPVRGHDARHAVRHRARLPRATTRRRAQACPAGSSTSRNPRPHCPQWTSTRAPSTAAYAWRYQAD